MRCTCFRADPATLVAALTDPALLARYQQAVADEVPSIADRQLLKHLKRMSTLASRVQVDGLDAVAAQDRAAADELLSDLLAVATWHGWELPLEPLGEHDPAVAGRPRGLLGADAGTDSARVWLLDGGVVALSRSREAADTADVSTHPRA